ncbi:ABC transporter ATP-binding protein [Steroidobacter agaridevorans]|uniref:ABC transporter ATP-binding protein n=1 Tax=Steroidobacter agaridevorans TaxID=2695856 RepID=A0A829Y7T5_9GAMM|nr:ABC transporter transmembrane domain-containing protein [Steroidobacter agaridevorans]GFE79329.1 ABC transporter ATP-binding protein [Steroidobacter agaridevorans]GFE88334.1 ABC transporter ATP-binding protein [Steroidobacter agaridevorans]
MSANPERPKARSLKPLRELWPYLSRYKGVLTLAMIALLLAAAAMLVIPMAFRDLIDRGMAAQDAATINTYFVAFLVAAALFGIFAALRLYFVTWLGERVVADLRADIYARVVRMDPTFFEVTRIGEVLSRLTTDTTLVQGIAGVNLSMTLRSIVQLIGALVLMIATSPSLAGMIVVLIPLVIFPIIAVGRKLRTLSRESQDKIADTSGLAGETLNAIQTVQAFTLEGLHTKRYSTAVEDSFRVALQRTKVRSAMSAIGTMMIFGAITFVLWQGAHRVLDKEMTGGELSQFLIYAVYVAIAAATLSEMWGEVQRAAGAMERLVELKVATPNIVAPPKPQPFPSPPLGRITFEHISFRYPSRPESLALDDLSLAIERGETVAFVGPSGAGKSTTFQLLLRFYDPASGRITIDGVDISQAKPEDVRARIGLVPQETVLFGTTARENIRYGRPNASDADIEAAARAAGADEFIRELPQGYDTHLGEKGTRLSGGQRQRIAIARALLKDPPILLLDEATSSLDAESERYVQEALERLMEHRTTLVIAHRLATILKADRIVVLDHGRIVDIGTHAQLLESNELYARLAALQFADLSGSVPATAA